MTSTRKAITRTCVACRTSSNKNVFVRVVRDASGQVGVDASGRKSGRGAYLCADLNCLNKAIKTDRLSSALRTKVDAAQYEQIRQDFLHLTSEESEG